MEGKYATIMKYNTFEKKNKEFSSFDTALEAQICFDYQGGEHIIEKDHIIDMNQGVPLYFFKTGMKDYNPKYLFSPMETGYKFSQNGEHFLIRNHVFLPHSYFTLILLDKYKYTELTNEIYDHKNFVFRYGGDTILHLNHDNYRNLSFLLEKYEERNIELINMLLLNNKDNQNCLSLALAGNHHKSVNLILSKVSKVSMNNIHQIKQNIS